jgi:hypothetical protein
VLRRDENDREENKGDSEILEMLGHEWTLHRYARRAGNFTPTDTNL